MIMSAAPTPKNALVPWLICGTFAAAGAVLIAMGNMRGAWLLLPAALFIPPVWIALKQLIPVRDPRLIRTMLAMGVAVVVAIPMLRSTSDGNATERSRGLPRGAAELTAKADPAQGHYYALLLAAEKYDHWPKLDRPIKDAQALKAIITKQYSFNEENVTMVEDPTRSQVLRELERLNTAMGPDDNLLIYYAGHGAVRDAGKVGSWIPVNGDQLLSDEWISSDDILKRLTGIQARHVLLLIDACFGGTLIDPVAGSRGAPPNDEAIKRIYAMKSRQAMTSGAAEQVSDNGPFIRLVRERLETNPDHFLPASSLFYSVQDSLRRDPDFKQVPVFSKINMDGELGGDFVFVRRSP